MNVWTFLDRHAFFVFAVAVLAVCGAADACSGRHHEASGCGVNLSIGSSAADGGAP